MTVLLLHPSPTEKLLKRSNFSAVLWIRYRRRLDSGGKSRTLGRDRRSAGEVAYIFHTGGSDSYKIHAQVNSGLAPGP